jgi:hypothetical protein
MARVRNTAARRVRSAGSALLGPKDPRLRRNNQGGVTGDDLDQDTIAINNDGRLAAIVKLPTSVKVSDLEETGIDDKERDIAILPAKLNTSGVGTPGEVMYSEKLAQLLSDPSSATERAQKIRELIDYTNLMKCAFEPRLNEHEDEIARLNALVESLRQGMVDVLKRFKE